MIEKEIIPSSYQMISFDVSSIFTIVPLDYTIDLTLKQIYGDKFMSFLEIIFTNKKIVLPWDLLLFQCWKEFLWSI